MQQDRLRKCSLTTLCATKQLTNKRNSDTKHHRQRSPESSRWEHPLGRVDWKSPKELLGASPKRRIEDVDDNAASDKPGSLVHREIEPWEEAASLILWGK
jgi:hypothetical protein